MLNLNMQRNEIHLIVQAIRDKLGLANHNMVCDPEIKILTDTNLINNDAVFIKRNNVTVPLLPIPSCIIFTRKIIKARAIFAILSNISTVIAASITGGMNRSEYSYVGFVLGLNRIAVRTQTLFKGLLVAYIGTFVAAIYFIVKLVKYHPNITNPELNHHERHTLYKQRPDMRERSWCIPKTEWEYLAGENNKYIDQIATPNPIPVGIEIVTREVLTI